MFEQLNKLWHVIPAPHLDEVDSARAPSGANDNTDGSRKDTVRSGEDEVDAGFSFGGPRKPTTDEPTTAISALARVPYYNMEHKRRGKFIIINNENFDRTIKESRRRKGTDVDADALKRVLKKIGFEVETEKDLTVKQMIELISKVAKQDHSDCDCLGVAVLSHGTSDDVLYGTDGDISLMRFVDPLKDCPTLYGKPKLIIVQACRGEEDTIDGVTENMDVDEDEVDGVQTIPREADFVYVHATPPGRFAWRNKSKGSWFIQALCKQVEAFAYKVDLLTLLTLVNNQVASDYESETGKPATNDMRQVSSVESMLTKMLWFKPKN